MFCKNCGKEYPDGGNFCPFCGFNANPGAVVPMANPPSPYNVASTGLRFVNYFVDYIFSTVLMVAIIFAAVIIYKVKVPSYFWSIFGFVYAILYYVFFEGLWLRTPAKFITRTKVVMEDGSRPDFVHILGRSLARAIPFEAFSFLAGPRGWHDTLSKTMVVPSHYEPEQVRQIDLKNQPKTSTALIIVIVVFFSIVIIGLLSSVVLLALNSARAKSRDAKRIADVRQIQSALELYYNDFSKYPGSLSNLGSTYIGTLPTAPTPADGKCTDQTNKYNYVLLGGNDYRLSFCLGLATGGYEAGMHVMSSKGIDKVPDNSSQATPSNTADWQQFNAADGSFKAMLPVLPNRNDSTEKLSNGYTIDTTVYTSEVSNSIAYVIGIYKYSQPLDASKADAMLEGGLNGIISSNPKNALLSSGYSNYGNYRALDFEVQQNDIYLKGRMIIAGQTMYGMINAYKLEAYNEADYNKFIDSLVIAQ